jgi:dihydroorotase
MKAKFLTLTLVGSAFIGGCTVIQKLDNAEATHILSGKNYPPTDQVSVKIFVERPDFRYEVIGLVEARGMAFLLGGEEKDQQLAIFALKREAAKIGADGIIITDSRQEVASVSKEGTSTERRIKGLAIKWK